MEHGFLIDVVIGIICTHTHIYILFFLLGMKLQKGKFCFLDDISIDLVSLI